MSESLLQPTGAQRWASRVLAPAAIAGLLLLPVWAMADQWRAPALVPQVWGSRGLRSLTAPGSRVLEAVGTSLLVAAISTTIALVLAWPAARWLALAGGTRTTRRLRAGAVILLAAPLLVPGYAVGTGLASWLIERGIDGHIAGLVTAHLVYVVPYVVLILAPGFTPRLRDLEELAAVSGASASHRLRWVTLPAMTAPLVVATLMGFVVSWSQYGTSLAVGAGRPTLPLVLLPFVDRDPQVAAALTVVFLIPPFIAVIAMRRQWRLADG